jgi:transcriptional regulator with XRE-family HTH domain
VKGGTLIREARRRADLTQAELAHRLGTTQSAIARLEGGGSEPSFRRVAQAIRACGFELVPSLTPVDASDWSVASVDLRVDPDERVRRHRAALRFARAGREALRRGGG